MDETPMYFYMVPQKTLTNKRQKQVRVRSSGSEKKRLTVALTCTGDGKMLPAVAIFKGKRKLKFEAPSNVKLQVKGWMDSDLMLRWFKAVALPYTIGRIVIDSFSAHETEEFIALAQSDNVDVVIIPGGCTIKIQPLDVCFNKPFKDILRRK